MAPSLPPRRTRSIEIACAEGIHHGALRVRIAAARMPWRAGRDAHVPPLVRMVARTGHSSEQPHALRALERIGTRTAAERAKRDEAAQQLKPAQPGSFEAWRIQSPMRFSSIGSPSWM